MSALSCPLARNQTATWRIVFDQDSLHLYVEHVRPDRASDPLDWMSLDDFLARKPADALQQRALECLVSLLADTISAGPRALEAQAQSGTPSQ